MQRIVPAILSLEQHRDALRREPVIYRPSGCPRCGLARLWGHGGYARKADRDRAASGSLNPVLIPRANCKIPAAVQNSGVMWVKQAHFRTALP